MLNEYITCSDGQSPRYKHVAPNEKYHLSQVDQVTVQIREIHLAKHVHNRI